jgi:hypothetical protein
LIPIQKINTANAQSTDAIRRGDVVMSLLNRTGTTRVMLLDALHAPGVATTLISVSRLNSAKFQMIFGGGMCQIITPNKVVIAKIPVAKGLYAVRTPSDHLVQCANIATQRISLAEAHRIMGHISYGAVRDAIHLGQVKGIELDDSTTPEFCEACARAKQH